jgi:1-deoxy-D-xylulose-5-phosphate synthase
MDLDLLAGIRTPQDLKRIPIGRLPELAAEIRWAICNQIRKSGGHLAPNLGVVELTIAMHYVFDFGHDRLLFDVGHQCYPHKLLTGRLGMLDGLRTRGGMSGFPEPRERFRSFLGRPRRHRHLHCRGYGPGRHPQR